MAQTSIPAGRCRAAVGGLMHLLSEPATVQALARSSEGIVFWSLPPIRRLCATADGSSTPTRQPLFFSFTFHEESNQNLQDGWKNGKTATAKFPGHLKFGLEELVPALNTVKKCYYYLIPFRLRLVCRCVLLLQNFGERVWCTKRRWRVMVNMCELKR